jgi:hypothetical protein
MSAPVVVSRIQNRRGTQTQFNALYPVGYTGVGGFTPTPVSPPPVTITASSGTGTVATLTVSALPAGISVGSQIIVTGNGAYDGTYIVTSLFGLTISYASTATGSVTGGLVTFPYNIVNYPNVLMPGELALCTDTRNVFLGNLNGEYLELGQASSSGISITPLVITLPPAATFTVIPSLTFTAVPFTTIWYDAIDGSTPDWDILGMNFSRNGQLQITAITNADSATLIDSSTEINNYTGQLSFEAVYNGTNVQISYINTLTPSTSVTFSTSTIQWITF